MLVALLAALGQSVSLLIDKIILSKRRVDEKTYLLAVFFFIFVGGVILYPFFGRVNWTQALELKNVLIFSVIVVSAFIWNILYCEAVKKEDVGEVQLISMTQPIMTILLASILLPAERSLDVIFVSLFAALVLIYAHKRRYSIKFDKPALWLIFGVFLMALESVLAKFLLDIYSPLAFYCFRVAMITVFFVFYTRKNFFSLNFGNQSLVVLNSLIALSFMVLKLVGYQKYGVVNTATILLLSPAFVYLLNPLILKEKIPKKTIYATIVILLAIVYLQLR